MYVTIAVDGSAYTDHRTIHHIQSGGSVSTAIFSTKHDRFDGKDKTYQTFMIPSGGEERQYLQSAEMFEARFG